MLLVELVTVLTLTNVLFQVSVVSLAADRFGFSELGVFQSFRTLRALGLLRAVSRVQGLKVRLQRQTCRQT